MRKKTRDIVCGRLTRLLRLGVISCLPFASAPGQSADLLPDQWTILGSGNLRPGIQYGLFNNLIRKTVRYQQRENGINLGWDDSNSRSVTFERAGNGVEPIVFGERIAIRVRNGGYLRYQERDYGINLAWSTVPIYEWEITGGTTGAPVPVSSSSLPSALAGVRLYNAEHGDYVLYGEREHGINLRWYADKMYAHSGLYPPLPFPPELRSPSGEPGQAVLRGRASEVRLFHGGTDDELDWHVYITLDSLARSRLYNHLLRHGGARQAHNLGGASVPLREDELNRAYAELMVLDGYKNTSGDDRFFSADVTRALGLGRTAWSYSVEAGESQRLLGLKGATVTPRDSHLVNDSAFVFLQGQLVNDRAHGYTVEIHPLDSFAYAIDGAGQGIRVMPTDSRWPTETITWRVAVFTNSSYHRINRAAYVQKRRTTTWYLALPRGAAASRTPPGVTVAFPGFENHPMRAQVTDLTRRRVTSQDPYSRYGVISQSYGIERDPSDGVVKLRVTVQMDTPDRWGGMFLGEYRVTLSGRRDPATLR